MTPKTELAIVLKSVTFRERDRIVTAITPNFGKISAVARNAIQSRRFGGALELFTASEWTLQEKPHSELWRLDGAIARRSFEGIRKDFARLALAGIFSEILLRIAPEQAPCEELFRLHSNALAALEELPPSEGLELRLLNSYLTKILQWSGNQPILHQCRKCERSLIEFMDEPELCCTLQLAGWLCPSCKLRETPRSEAQEHARVTDSLFRLRPIAIHDFWNHLSLPIRKTPEASLSSIDETGELFEFLEALLIYHVPGMDRAVLKAMRFLPLPSTLKSRLLLQSTNTPS